jgi:hypothetical protein
MRKVLTAELIEEARVIYEGGVEPIDVPMTLLGMKQTAFYKFMKEQGWRMRRDYYRVPAMPARPNARVDAQPATGEAAVPAPSVPVEPLTPDEMIPKIEAALNRELAHVQHALAHGEPRNAERTAKTMASLVRTLAELKRVQREAHGHDGRDDRDDDEPPARDVAELKAELARRIDLLRRARDAERSS